MFHIDKSVENPHLDGFLLHTLKTTNKVLRYGENNHVDFSEHPTGGIGWRCTHNQHLCRRSKCSIGQVFDVSTYVSYAKEYAVSIGLI